MPKVKDVKSDFRYIRIKVPRSDYEKFERLYQGLEQLTLLRSFYYVLQSQDNFDKIFWSVRLPEDALPQLSREV